MGKVVLKVPPFFASMLDPKSSGWLVVETEITEYITIRDLLTMLAKNNHDFRQSVFNPDTETLNGQIDIVINQKFLPFPHELDAKLIDGDIITLIPMLAGG